MDSDLYLVAWRTLVNNKTWNKLLELAFAITEDVVQEFYVVVHPACRDKVCIRGTWVSIDPR